jgi:hypothetical protein
VAFKNDYMMRVIEQLGVALARIIFLKGKEEYGEAEALISRTAQSLLGFDMALLRRLSDEGIIALLRRPDASDVGAYLAAAELLREQGEIDATGRGSDGNRGDAGYDCDRKALSLYLECYLNAPEIWTDDLAGKVAALLERLRPYALPAAIQRKLFAYYEGQDDYAEAENVIHHLLEDAEPGAWEDGLAFYERLQAKSDEELAHGGLPREEVEEGLLAFEELAES